MDEYGLALAEALRYLLPNWVPQGRQFRVKVTHDVDLTGLPDEDSDEHRYDDGGWIKVTIVLDDGQRLTAEYSNYHNGYYAHSVTVFENGDVVYDGTY